MRKMSAYTRKLRRGGEAAQHYQGAAWLNTIQACRTYSAEAPEWSGLSGTMPAATESLLVVNDAADNLLHHRVPPEDTHTYEVISHAIDVAHIRYMHIQPDTDNPAHAPLIAAKATMNAVAERRRRTGRWGLSGPERAVLAKAIELYETVLLASSPKQMQLAARMRRDGLKRGKVWVATK